MDAAVITSRQSAPVSCHVPMSYFKQVLKGGLKGQTWGQLDIGSR